LLVKAKTEPAKKRRRIDNVSDDESSNDARPLSKKLSTTNRSVSSLIEEERAKQQPIYYELSRHQKLI
jgi:hypothetical protein